jgi:hypothetical protein
MTRATKDVATHHGRLTGNLALLFIESGGVKKREGKASVLPQGLNGL